MKKVLGYIVIVIFGVLIVQSYHNQSSNEQVAQPKIDPTQDRSPLIIAQVETSPYLSFVDWPPARQEVAEAYSCTPAGEAINRAGATTERMIADTPYCVTEITEGAAGSTYHQYAYITDNGENASVGYTFSVRMVQCMNYDEPAMTECQVQQEAFNPDLILQDYFAQSL